MAEEAASSLKLAAEVQDAAKDISRRLGDLLEEGRSRLGGVLEVAPTAIEVAPVAIPRQKAAPPSPQNHAPLSLALPPLLAVVATNRAK